MNSMSPASDIEMFLACHEFWRNGLCRYVREELIGSMPLFTATDVDLSLWRRTRPGLCCSPELSQARLVKEPKIQVSPPSRSHPALCFAPVLPMLLTSPK